MRRKLIQLSPSTAVISMPAKWLKNNGLKKGDELDVQVSENAVLISTESKRTSTSTTVDLRKLDDNTAFTYADAAYVAGHDEITFLITRKQQENVIDYVAKEVPGMIVHEQTEQRVVFKDITGNNSPEITGLIDRIYNMLIAMLDDSIKAQREKDYRTLVQMKKRDHILNSYVSYCQRLINKYGYNNFAKTGLVVTYLKLLEMIADNIARTLITIGKTKKHQDLEPNLKLLRLLHRMHTSFSQERLITCDKMRKNIDSELSELVHNLLEVEVQYQL